MYPARASASGNASRGATGADRAPPVASKPSDSMELSVASVDGRDVRLLVGTGGHVRLLAGPVGHGQRTDEGHDHDGRGDRGRGKASVPAPVGERRHRRTGRPGLAVAGRGPIELGQRGEHVAVGEAGRWLGDPEAAAEVERPGAAAESGIGLDERQFVRGRLPVEGGAGDLVASSGVGVVVGHGRSLGRSSGASWFPSSSSSARRARPRAIRDRTVPGARSRISAISA